MIYYSSPGVEIKDSTKKDIEPVAAYLRSADAEEIWASHNSTPTEALVHGLKNSIPCLTAWIDGFPVAMTGCAPVSDTAASVWFLGTDIVDEKRYLFGRCSKKILKIFRGMYPVLYNYVDVRNTTSIEWLEWLGAKFEPAAPYGALGMPFRYFTIGDQHV